MTGAWSPVGERELRVGLVGPRARWAATTSASSAALPGVRLVAVADPVPARPRRGQRAGPAPSGFAEPLAMLAEADLDAVVIAAPTTSPPAAALAAIERGIAVLVEKPLAATIDGGRPDRRRGVRAAGRPGPGRPHRAVQPGDPRARPAPRGGLAVDGLLAISSRRAGPFPARIRDVGVTVDLATHDVDILCCDRRRSARRASRPRRPGGSTPTHEDLLFGLLSFPSGTVAHARRRLAHPGQATPADGPRRGGDVRARLPHPAPDLRPRHGHVAAAADRRLRADLRERRRRAARSPRASRSSPSSRRS